MRTEVQTAPKGNYFKVDGMLNGKARVRSEAGEMILLTMDELAGHERKNTRLTTNEFDSLYPPIQSAGIQTRAGNAMVEAAFQSLSDKYDALERRFAALEARVK